MQFRLSADKIVSLPSIEMFCWNYSLAHSCSDLETPFSTEWSLFISFVFSRFWLSHCFFKQAFVNATIK